ncbi:unnamed protein product, partial [Symbiodinium pilosum]
QCAAALLLMQLATVSQGLRPSDTSDHDKPKVNLPRTCENTFSGSKCCGCGPPREAIGNRAKDKWLKETSKTYGYIDSMCSKSSKPDDLKICCPLWAVDCKQEDYYFQQGLERDCAAPPRECKYYECRDVSRLLEKLDKQFYRATLFDDEPEDTLEERLRKDSDASITGHGTFCSCACGELMDEEKLTCKALNSSFVCSNTRPCCRRLSEDCAKDDPWPKEVRTKTREVSKAQAVDATAKKVASKLLKALKNLERKCVKSCDVLRKSECVAHLSTVVEKVTFGKDVTVQSKLEEARFAMLLAYNEEHPDEATWESSTQRVFNAYEYELDKALEE